MYVLTAGTHLGRFILINLLGKGGMGEVWRGQDPRLGREVAIKVLPPELARDPDSQARFERESKILAALNHPYIAHLYEAGEEIPVGPGSVPGNETISFLVMELIEGKSLSDILLSGPIAPFNAVRIARQIAKALYAAHRAGIVHRDLKPANIMVTTRNQIKVLDFGLARPVGVPGAAGPVLPEVTVPGMVMGTAAYLSPEQVKGNPADARSDIWALGCVLYQMLAGHRPFPSNSVPEILAGILRDNPDDLTDLNPNLPSELTMLVQRCFQKDPDLRPQSAQEISVALKAIMSKMRPATEPKASSSPASTAPSTVHIETINRYLKMIHLDYPQLIGRESGPSFQEILHKNSKIGILISCKPNEKYDLIAFVSPVCPLPQERKAAFFKRLLTFSNGISDVAQFAIDPATNSVNLVCVRVCAHLDFKEFQYTLDAISKIALKTVPALKREFGVS